MIRKNKLKKKSKVFNLARPYVYLAPALITIFIMGILPMIYTIYIAFTNYNINHLDDFKIIGFSNFQSIINGPFKSIFFPVFGWTLFYALLATLGCFIIGLVLAMLLNNADMKESPIYKGVLILPWALPSTIAIMAWIGLLDMSYGGINILLKALHLIKDPIPWLIDPTWARVGIIIATVWLGYPYMMNVCIGALSSISNAFYEAADIDGATRWQKFINITLPSIASASLPLLISSFAFNFSNMQVAYLITAGNPVRASSQYAGYTDILASTVYKMSMNYNRYDIGAAFSIIIFIIVGSLSFINFKLTGTFKEEV